MKLFEFVHVVAAHVVAKHDFAAHVGYGDGHGEALIPLDYFVTELAVAHGQYKYLPVPNIAERAPVGRHKVGRIFAARNEKPAVAQGGVEFYSPVRRQKHYSVTVTLLITTG